MIGEHIRALKNGRWMHAIDCGDETVLHLAEEPPPRRVRRAYRPEFLAGAASVETVTHRERTFPPREVVRRAYSRASVPALASMFGDSEAFAAWCTTGRAAARHLPAAPVAEPGEAAGAPAPTRGAPRPRRAQPVRRPKASARGKRPAKRSAAGRSGSKARTRGRGRSPRGRP